jgi:hypothetical protein
VARVEIAPEVVEDFERILDHLDTCQVEHPERRIDEIIAALSSPFASSALPLLGVATGCTDRVHGFPSLAIEQLEDRLHFPLQPVWSTVAHLP